MKLTIEKIFEQGFIAHQNGDIDDAESSYRHILEVQPTHADANYNLGQIAISREDTASAITRFEAALKGSPEIEEFWLTYIQALFRGQQFEKARLVLQDGQKRGVLKKVSTEVAKPEERALRRKKIENENKNQKFRRRSKKKPNLKQKSRLLKAYQNGELQEAESIARSFVLKFPGDSLAWKILGATLAQTNREAEALEALRTSVGLAPTDAETYNNLGNIYIALGRYTEAQSSLERAISLMPNFALAYSNLGAVLCEFGDFSRAISCCQKAIELEPDFPRAHNNLGIALQSSDRYREAESAYRKAISVAPDFVEPLKNLGRLLRQIGQKKEAEIVDQRRSALGKSDRAQSL